MSRHVPRSQSSDGDVPATPRHPRPLLRGRLVYLRPAERSDLPLFVAWLSDAETSQHLAIRAPLGMALEERWFEAAVEKQGSGQYHFVICLLDDGRPIGAVDLHDIDYVDGTASLGIVIGDRDDRDRGHGTDSLDALLDFAFGELRLERVQLDVFEGNDRAIRSYEKAGFVREGVFRRARFQAGRRLDVTRMAILREEWSALDRPRSWEFADDETG